jgi:hypothetical protein
MGKESVTPGSANTCLIDCFDFIWFDLVCCICWGVERRVWGVGAHNPKLTPNTQHLTAYTPHPTPHSSLNRHASTPLAILKVERFKF